VTASVTAPGDTTLVTPLRQPTPKMHVSPVFCPASYWRRLQRSAKSIAGFKGPFRGEVKGRKRGEAGRKD